MAIKSRITQGTTPIQNGFVELARPVSTSSRGKPQAVYEVVADRSGSVKDHDQSIVKYSSNAPRVIAGEFPELVDQIHFSLSAISGGLWPGKPMPIHQAEWPEVVAGGNSPILRSFIKAFDNFESHITEVEKIGPVVSRTLVIVTDCLETEISAVPKLAIEIEKRKAASPHTQIQLIVPDENYDRQIASILLREGDQPLILADAMGQGKETYAYLTDRLRQVAIQVSNTSIRPGDWQPIEDEEE